MLQPENPLVGADPDAVAIDPRRGSPARRTGGPGALRARLKDVVTRRRAQRATLPWDEFEAEAARQGCSPADIFFDRAGLGRPEPVELDAAAAADDDDEVPQYVPWRGLDPRPRA